MQKRSSPTLQRLIVPKFQLLSEHLQDSPRFEVDLPWFPLSFSQVPEPLPGVREAAGTGPSLWQRLGLGDLATWGERASSHRDLMAFKGLRGRTGNQQPPIGMVQRVLLGLQLDEVPQNRLPMSFFGMFLAQFLQVSCANFIPADGGIIGFNLHK